MRRSVVTCSCCSSTRRGSPLTEQSTIRLVGAVLTGGASRRMGRTKALVEIDGVPMAVRVADALRAAGCASVVAIGGDVDEIATLGLPILPDTDPGGGPLAGVLTALEASAGSDSPGWLCVVACDLPGLDAATVLRLAAAAQDHPSVDVVVARTDRLEPGCALWSTQAAPKVRAMYDGGVRAVHGALDVLVVVAVDVDSGALRNINTPEDLGRYPGPSD